jgi:hypothetical protein
LVERVSGSSRKSGRGRQDWEPRAGGGLRGVEVRLAVVEGVEGGPGVEGVI